VAPDVYPLSGADTLKSRPGWFHPDYTSTDAANLDATLDVQETGDVAHRNPILAADNPLDAEEVAALQDASEDLGAAFVDSLTARDDSTAYAEGDYYEAEGRAWEVTTAGTSAASPPAGLADAGTDIGETVVDGTATVTRRY
jgi:hypothetical protein